MPLQLSHIGEELIAEMLACVAERGDLANVACQLTGRTLADDVREYGLTGPLSFRADQASLRVNIDNRDYDCDGAQTVDILCAGGGQALAIEAKLGYTRMAPAEFIKRFCVPCEISRHPDGRLCGKMIAVLERSFPEAVPIPSRLVCRIDDMEWTAAVAWWLVVRRSVLKQWKKSGQPAFLSRSARVIDFDTLAELYGLGLFDQLVQRVAGSDFARRWGLLPK
jgi:hypothetical protein